MHIYEYGCKYCDHTFEIWQGINARRKRKCPECKKRNALSMLLGTTSFRLKGDGWAQDGYSKVSQGDVKSSNNGDK